MAELLAVRRLVVIGIVVLVLALAIGVPTMINLSPAKNVALATWIYVLGTLVLAFAAIVAGYFAKRNVEAFERAHDDQMSELREQRRQFETFERLSFRPFVTVSSATVDETGQIMTIEIANVGRGPAIRLEIAMWFTQLEGNVDDRDVFESHREVLAERARDVHSARVLFRAAGLSPGTSTTKISLNAGLRPLSPAMAFYHVTYEDMAGNKLRPIHQFGAVEPPDFRRS